MLPNIDIPELVSTKVKSLTKCIILSLHNYMIVLSQFRKYGPKAYVDRMKEITDSMMSSGLI